MLLKMDLLWRGFASHWCCPALSEGWWGKCRLALCHWWLCHQTKCILKGKFPRERHFILHSLPLQPNMVAAGIPLLATDVWPLPGEPWQLLETASGSILGKEHPSDVCGHFVMEWEWGVLVTCAGVLMPADRSRQGCCWKQFTPRWREVPLNSLCFNPGPTWAKLTEEMCCYIHGWKFRAKRQQFVQHHRWKKWEGKEK